MKMKLSNGTERNVPVTIRNVPDEYIEVHVNNALLIRFEKGYRKVLWMDSSTGFHRKSFGVVPLPFLNFSNKFDSRFDGDKLDIYYNTDVIFRLKNDGSYSILNTKTDKIDLCALCDLQNEQASKQQQRGDTMEFSEFIEKMMRVHNDGQCASCKCSAEKEDGSKNEPKVKFVNEFSPKENEVKIFVSGGFLGDTCIRAVSHSHQQVIGYINRDGKLKLAKLHPDAEKELGIKIDPKTKAIEVVYD